VARKDAAASVWCENAALLSGTIWRYKVPQKAFTSLQPADFSDLNVLGA
jgi:hypothetical protein